MQPQVYEFYVNNTRVYPHYKQLKKKYALESGQRFFRETLDGKISLFGFDYKIIKDASINKKHTFKIYTYINNVRTLYFEGEFTKTDCKFYNDKRQVELSISPKDGYTDILNAYDHEYNLVELKPKLSEISMNKRPVLQIYCPEDNKVGNFMGGVYWESEVTESQSNIVQLQDKFNFILDFVGYDVRVDSGQYKGIYAGMGGLIISYDNTELIFESSGGIEIDIHNGNYDFSKLVMTAKNKNTGVALYRGNLSGSSRFITATLNAIGGSGASGTLSINVTVYYFMSRYLCASSSGIDSNGSVLSFKNVPSDDFAVSGLNYAYCHPFKLTGELDVSPKLSVEPTKYGKAEDGRYFEQSPGNVHWFPIARSSWDYTSMWFSQSDRTKKFDSYNITRYRMKDGVTIGQAIKALLKKVAPNIQHEETEEYSRFLYGKTNPITGDAFTILITQKTNVLKGIYDEPATKAPITFENLMNMLRDCFKCYWYIENGKLKIEHIWYFMNGRSYGQTQNGLDLTNTVNAINSKAYSYGQNNFEYDKSDLSGRYEFGWMDDCTDLYDGFPINVDAVYVQSDKTENITIDNFSSDIDLMLLTPNSFSEDGFALMCCEYYSDVNFYSFPFGEVTFIDEKGISYSIETPNYYATWFYLQQFYMYDMPATDISYDGIQDDHLQVLHIKKCMQQQVKFPIKANENDPDLYQLIKTDNGYGEISELSIDIDTKQVEATLLYEPV
jgi:hypothetical protein